jgi:hypothetical protein
MRTNTTLIAGPTRSNRLNEAIDKDYEIYVPSLFTYNQLVTQHVHMVDTQIVRDWPYQYPPKYAIKTLLVMQKIDLI